MTRLAAPLGVALALLASSGLAKDRDDDRNDRSSIGNRPQIRSNNQPGISGGGTTPRINIGGNQNSNPGNSGGGQPPQRKIEMPRNSGDGNPGGILGGQPRIRGQSDNDRPKVTPPAGGGPPVFRRRDNDNQPGNNPPVIKPRNNTNPPNIGNNQPNKPIEANKSPLKPRDGDTNQPRRGDLVKPRDRVIPNQPKGGNVVPNNPLGGNKPTLKPRDNNQPGKNLPNIGGNPSGGNKPTLKPRDHVNKPNLPNIGGNTPNNPLGGNRPVLKPDTNSKIPNLGDRNRGDNKGTGPKVGRNPELNDAIKRIKPDTARRERNERDLVKNKDQVEKLLNSNPQLRERIQNRDGKVDLAKLHQEQNRKDRIAAKIDKNDFLSGKFDKDGDDDFRHFGKVKDLDDLDRRFDRMRDPELIKQHPELKNVDWNNVSGRFQHKLAHQQHDQLVASKVGHQLKLQDQYALYGQGDVARQMNLNVVLINNGGWQNRYVGPIYGGFTSHSFSSWYCGPGFYPRYAWTPIWSPWVDWCWWHVCPPIYDPRPIICRPIYFYDPCPVWVVYDYPVWQPLPVVASGTWIDLPSPVLVDNPDVQLVAVRFVDNGHPEQELGTRYRAWFQNNSNAAITAPFNVLMLASNTVNASADLPQAGVTVPAMDPGEMKVVDIRLPFAANKMNRVDNHLTPFEYLHVLVDSHRQLNDPTPENNGAVIARADIMPVDPAAFAPDSAAAAPGAIVSIAGEGFGPEPGRLIVSINGEQTEATIYGWYDLGVQFELPNINVTGPTDAEVLVVRGDGAAANPVTMKLAPENRLSDAILPPAPMP